jgi:hypothetical protein
MTADVANATDELRAMQDRVRAIRTRYCDPKSNPRYLALSNVVTNLTKAIEDLDADRP